ncbi:MAG: dethiobiotin synthase [Gammaproteobacteria bacterium]|nr:dethiobiotin synthase [Gammaproteobacteria bacterium]
MAGGRTLFVTGTDTGVGKTLIACGLIRIARQARVKVCGFKPVASGCERGADGLRNADALALRTAAGTRERYEDINPYAFEAPLAPHIAAQKEGRRIRTSALREAHGRLAARYGLVVAEGAGGWLVPLDETWTFAEWVADMDWPVLLVVGMRLGCLNHALLSAEAIARRAKLAGWVANCLPPAQECVQENIETLRHRIPAPCWGVVPAGAADAAPHLQFDPEAFLRPPAAPGDAD